MFGHAQKHAYFVLLCVYDNFYDAYIWIVKHIGSEALEINVYFFEIFVGVSTAGTSRKKRQCKSACVVILLFNIIINRFVGNVNIMYSYIIILSKHCVYMFQRAHQVAPHLQEEVHHHQEGVVRPFV
jgi:hypothetical protein